MWLKSAQRRSEAETADLIFVLERDEAEVNEFVDLGAVGHAHVLAVLDRVQDLQNQREVALLSAAERLEHRAWNGKLASRLLVVQEAVEEEIEDLHEPAVRAVRLRLGLRRALLHLRETRCEAR